ncbi:MAG: type III pantothenate kinase [Moraxella sp.]|nr:type III pantothenate kinase [Moraxella sp.]
MKLWLDLGNTRLKYWIIDSTRTDNQIIAQDAREHLKAPNELLLGLMGTFAQYQPTFIGISSVLGEKINTAIASTLQRLQVDFEFATVSSTHPHLSTLYDPMQLGVDRWLQMLGVADAHHKQCVIGCGTALTIDLIDQGCHLGGYILPNAYMQRHALYAGTQQIAVKAGRFDSTALGTNTFDAVNHGVMFGIVGAVREACERYSDFALTLTGGGANLLSAHLTHPHIVNEELLLLGLRRYFIHQTQKYSQINSL